MAIDRTPVLKRCRQLGIDPAELGYSSKKESIRQPKRRRKESEYGMQLREKQKVKFIYGVLEKQFHGYFNKARKMNGVTGENLMIILESRLDNVVFRLGFARTRKEARQSVRHGHFTVNGKRGKGVTAKDIVLYIISKISASGGTGHFIEFAGEAIRDLSMEERMTVCNMSIECGARGGIIAPDQTTFDYVKGRNRAPQGADFDKAVAAWKELYSDQDAHFDTEYAFDAADIEPMITYGTNPGMGMGITGTIPSGEGLSGSDKVSFDKSLNYMGFHSGEKMLGKKVDYVFLGSCTNGRIEDFRQFANAVKGRKKAENVIAWLVPGSWMVDAQIRKEGIDKILTEAGFAIRQPGCSACLAMNDDKIPAGKYSVSTSNRNFEGRQGPGARTLLASPLVAAAAAVTGVITDPRELM